MHDVCLLMHLLGQFQVTEMCVHQDSIAWYVHLNG